MGSRRDVYRKSDPEAKLIGIRIRQTLVEMPDSADECIFCAEGTNQIADTCQRTGARGHTNIYHSFSSLYLSLFIFLSLYFSLKISLFIFLSIYFFLYLSLSIYFSINLSLSLSIFLSLSFSLCLYLSFFFSLSSFSVCLSLFIYLSLSLYLSFSLVQVRI